MGVQTLNEAPLFGVKSALMVLLIVTLTGLEITIPPMKLRVALAVMLCDPAVAPVQEN